MITENDFNGSKTFKHALFHTFILIPTSLLLLTVDDSISYLYGFIALISGLWFLFETFKTYQIPSNQSAKKIILVSVIYLPLLLLAIILDVNIN